MLILGIETSCDETGVAVYDGGLLAHAVHSQVSMHDAYGGVVPELASRDHIRRLVPLTREVLSRAGRRTADLTGIGYTEGPGLAGALLVGASFAHGLAQSLGIPAVGIHHLEGHLLSPLISEPAPQFPFVALLVSGGHTQLMRVEGIGRYLLLGETQDDAAGEAFDKTAKLLGLGYPGGPALSQLAQSGTPGRYRLPRPMIGSGDLEFSFSGLKTAVVTLAKQDGPAAHADIARAFVDAVVEVQVAEWGRAMELAGLTRLGVAGGVGANHQLRQEHGKETENRGIDVLYTQPHMWTNNGVIITLSNTKSLLQRQGAAEHAFSVRPRWELETIS